MIKAAILILALTAMIYLPALRGEFIWDDVDYIQNNSLLRSVEGLWRIWTEFGATPQYYPLVFTTFWVEYQLWQLNTLGYHVVNVVLHGLCAFLFYGLLKHLKIPGALLAACIFAVHPVHVESVAWIAERKNVLSGCFFLMSLLAFLRFWNSASSKWGWYLVSLIVFLFALLSKTSACVLPVALLLVCFLRGNSMPIRPLMFLPFFAVGIAFGLLTTWLEYTHVGAGGDEWSLSILERILLAGRVFWFYLSKLVWPSELLFFYPRWSIDPTEWSQYLFPLCALAVFFVLWLLRKKLGSGPWLALFYYVIALAPVLGFFRIYFMRFSYVADHFQYLASMGPIAFFGAVMTKGVQWRISAKRAAGYGLRIGLPAMIVLILGLRSWAAATMYMDPEYVWRDTLSRNPSAWIAHNNLGSLLHDRGNIAEAEKHYAEARRLCPNIPEPWTNLGTLWMEQGRIIDGIDALEHAVKIAPKNFTARFNLAAAYLSLEKIDAAMEEFRQALVLRPADTEVRLMLGILLEKAGHFDEARDELRRLLLTEPNHDRAKKRLSDLLRDRAP